jgi:hypothetical protein
MRMDKSDEGGLMSGVGKGPLRNDETTKEEMRRGLVYSIESGPFVVRDSVFRRCGETDFRDGKSGNAKRFLVWPRSDQRSRSSHRHKCAYDPDTNSDAEHQPTRCYRRDDKDDGHYEECQHGATGLQEQAELSFAVGGHRCDLRMAELVVSDNVISCQCVFDRHRIHGTSVRSTPETLDSEPQNLRTSEPRRSRR